MPRESNGEKRPADAHACAVIVARIATGEIQDGGLPAPGRRRSGAAGAEARKESLSHEQRRAIAKKAAQARWGQP